MTKVNVTATRKAAGTVKKVALVIATIGAVTSFGTQVGLLVSWHMAQVFAIGVAATVDLLAVCAMIALTIPGFPARDRKIVGTVLFFALTASIGANITAGLRESVGAAIGHSWPVVAYMGAELIAGRIRNFLAKIEATENANVPTTSTPILPATVEAIVPTVAAVAPRVAATVSHATSAAVKMGSHAGHDHPATPAGRAACRKAMLTA